MKRRYVILIHLIFWVLFISTNLWNSISRGILTIHQSNPVNFLLFAKYLTVEFGYILLPAASFYSGSLLVAPQIALRKSYFRAFLFSITTLVFAIMYRYCIEYYFFKPILGFDNYNGNVWKISRYISNVFFYYFPSYFVYGLLYFFIVDWNKTRHRQQELEQQKTTAELTFLRSQLNPHFLFNSINDIYSLTYRQSEQAPAALLKLSDILRYMLREGKEDTMPLQNEVTYLESVIELQRISTKGEAYINFTIEGYVGSQKIATLLLIAFVENAFKHGLLTERANPISINLSATVSSLTFIIRNKKNRYQKDKTPGIGLKNVSRRLDLMYPQKHHLDIYDDAEYYTVNLQMLLL